jgi:hypothetical protein
VDSDLTRCAAADKDDPTPCEGPLRAVTIVAADGGEIMGCVQHSARQLASMEGSRLHPLSGLWPWALDIYCRAAELPPFPWQIGL